MEMMSHGYTDEELDNLTVEELIEELGNINKDLEYFISEMELVLKEMAA